MLQSLMDPTIGENIKALREAAGFAQQNEFATALGVPQSRVSDWERDRYALPDTASLIKIAKVVGRSINTILRGIDKNYDLVVNNERGNDVEDEYIDVSGHTPDDIPVISEGDASPDGGVFYDDNGVLLIEVEDRITRPYDVTDTKAYGVRVRGDSMLPTYKPGMVLIVSPNTPVRDGDEVYVQLLSGERLIKIAKRVSHGWLLESLNPSYSHRYVKKSEVRSMHPIIWSRRRQDRTVTSIPDHTP